jgi:hypothetical protein
MERRDPTRCNKCGRPFSGYECCFGPIPNPAANQNRGYREQQPLVHRLVPATTGATHTGRLAQPVAMADPFYRVHFSRVERCIFDVIRASGEERIAFSRVAEKVYGSSVKTKTGIVRTYVGRINAKLASIGMRLATAPGNGGGVWLEKIDVT